MQHETTTIDTYVITTKVDSARARNIRAETAKLDRWSVVHFLEMDTPCTDYMGESDSSVCVQQNLFENHQKCAQLILESGKPFGLVLESDVAFSESDLEEHMTSVVEWAYQNHNRFDIIFIGGAYILDKSNALNTEHVKHVLEYNSKTHALIYSRQFCNEMVGMRWPNGHFDLWWGNHRRDLRYFASAKMLATVHHGKHTLTMNINKYLGDMIMTDSITVANIVMYVLTIVLCILVGCICVSSLRKRR